MPNNSMNFGVDLLPVTSSTYNLGNSSVQWKDVYGQNIYLNGTSLTSAATQNIDNEITSNNSSSTNLPTSSAVYGLLSSYTQSAATDTVIGGFKTGYSTSSAQQEYAVELSDDDEAYVTVPWENIYHTTGTSSWSSGDFTYTAETKGTESSGYDLSFTIPSGTTSDSFAIGSHEHGNILNNGTISSAGKFSIVTNDNGVIIAENLSTTSSDILSASNPSTIVTSITQDEIGKVQYATIDVSNFLLSSGGTLTGNLYLKNDQISLSEQAVSSAANFPVIRFVGTNTSYPAASIIAGATPVSEDNSTITQTSLYLLAANVKGTSNNGVMQYTAVHGGIKIMMDYGANNQGCTYSVDNPASFRSAINVPTVNGTNATGTWNISVSGNAATATKATQVLYTFNNANIAVANNNISSDGNINLATAQDTSAVTVTRVNTFLDASADKAVRLRLQARNYNSTTSSYGGFGGIDIIAQNDGTFDYFISSAANFRNAINALSTGGGTVTGTITMQGVSLTCKSNTIVKGTTLTSALSVTVATLNDKNGTATSANRLGLITLFVDTSSIVTTRLYAYKYNTSNATNGYFAAGYDTSNNLARTYSTCKVYGAVWNDYAEYRKGDTIEGGYCVTETSSGIMVKTTERLQPGCRITSDTFGFAIGQTEECQTPIAVSGRVLVYTHRPRNEYPLGAAVCSGPNGKIDLMTREEIKEYPDRIIGIVSEIPEYEMWECGGDGLGEGNTQIPVNGRIWIYVR